MTTKTFKIAEARAHFSQLLGRARSGEEILITKGREPQARLVPPPRHLEREWAPLAHLRLPVDLFDAEDREKQASMRATTTTPWVFGGANPANREIAAR